MIKLITRLLSNVIPAILAMSLVSQVVHPSDAVATVKKSQSVLSITNTNFISISGTPIILTAHGGSGLIKITFSTSSNDCMIKGDVLISSSKATCIVTATNPANGIYLSATSSPKLFSFINSPLKQQSPLVITNTELSVPAGSIIQLTSSGGSGQLSVTWTAVGSGCSLSGSTITSAYSSSCVVTATNPANGDYSVITSAPVTFSFTGKQQQSQLLITNTVLTNPYGATPVLITSSGGSGVIAISYTVTGLGCELTGNSLTSFKVAFCVVKAVNPANGDFASTESKSVNFIFVPQGTSCSVYASYNYPPLGLKASYTNGVLTISWFQQTLPLGTVMTYTAYENNIPTSSTPITATSIVENVPLAGVVEIIVYSKFSDETYTGCYFASSSTIYLQIP